MSALLPVLGVFRCDTFACVVTPATCAARHLALFDSRRGKVSPLHPTCAGCAIGRTHAGSASPAVPPRTVRAPRPRGSAARAPKPPPPPRPPAPPLPPCSKCHEHPAGRVRRGTERATPKGQEGWCPKCRQDDLHARQKAADRAARAAKAREPRPTCSKCHERPAGRISKLLPVEHHGLCRGCRDAARKADAYRYEVLVFGEHRVVSSNFCARCRMVPVGWIRKDTRPEHHGYCARCRQRVAEMTAQRAARAEGRAA